MIPERDMEYYQIRLWQLRKELIFGRYDRQEILNNIQYCKIRLEQRFLLEVELNKHNEIMY